MITVRIDSAHAFSVVAVEGAFVTYTTKSVELMNAGQTETFTVGAETGITSIIVHYGSGHIEVIN